MSVGAVIGPVDDVVDLEVAGVTATGNGAPAVTLDHDASGAVGDDVLRATDGDRDAVVVEHRSQQPVATDVSGHAVR